MPHYGKEELIEMAVKVIQVNDLVFIDEIQYYVPYCRSTFYDHNLDKLDEIREALGKNKVKKKKKLREKWENDINPTTQLALYRLLSNEYEHAKLNNTTIIKSDNEDDLKKKEIEKEMSADEASQIYSENMKKDE